MWRVHGKTIVLLGESEELWVYLSHVRLLQLARWRIMFLCHGRLDCGLPLSFLIISVCIIPLCYFLTSPHSCSHLHSQDAKDNEEGAADDHDVADGLQ